MNILFLTNPTFGCFGYSIVAHHVCAGLRKAGHNVWVLSTVITGDMLRDHHGTPNAPIYFDPYAKYEAEQFIRGFDIDLMVTMIDVWPPQAHPLPDIIHKLNLPLVCHATVRSYPLSPHLNTFLEKSDHIITPTKWGMEVVKEIFPNVSYIQHGVDLEVFKPDKGARDEIRKRLGYEDKFVFLAVGRNNEMQKRYDILFKAYKAFIENIPEAKEDTVLHIHANPHEVRGMDLEQIRNMGFYYISKELGRELVVFSKIRWNGEKLEICDQKDGHGMTLNPNWGLDEFEMAKFYNMADCFVHSGEGESFCIPCLEAQACGLPCIVPNHTAFPELVGKPKSGILTNIATEETTPTITDVKLPDILDLAKCMARMYKDKKLREDCSKNAVENAKNYEWKRIIDKWKFILEKVAEPKPTNYATGDLGF